MAEAHSYQKPLPVPDEDSQPFFQAAREHRLMIQQCRACGTAHWPFRSRCPVCLSPAIDWVQASGQGRLSTFTLVHHVAHPGFACDVPYILAEVDLQEGVRIISTIVDCPHAELCIGMPLIVTFADCTDEISLPVFRPAAGAEPGYPGERA